MPELRLAPHPPPHAEGVLEEAVQRRARPPARPAPLTSRAVWYASFTCPWICGSPRIIESSPEVTRKRCSAARRSRRA